MRFIKKTLFGEKNRRKPSFFQKDIFKPIFFKPNRETSDDPYKIEKDNVEIKPKVHVTREDDKAVHKELKMLISRTNNILLHAKGVFPFDFFPDTLTIDANKINIIMRYFFFSETATSIRLKEIMDVRVESVLFLGRLIIDYGPHPLKITTVYVPNLKKGDALKAKEIIEGILVLHRSENIDTTSLKPDETMEEIKDIGKIDERQ